MTRIVCEVALFAPRVFRVKIAIVFVEMEGKRGLKRGSDPVAVTRHRLLRD